MTTYPDLEPVPSALGQVLDWIDSVEQNLQHLDPHQVAAQLHARHPLLAFEHVYAAASIDRDARLDLLANLRRVIERELGATAVRQKPA